MVPSGPTVSCAAPNFPRNNPLSARLLPSTWRIAGSPVTNPSTTCASGAKISTVYPSLGKAQSASGVAMVAAYLLNRWITTRPARERWPSLNLFASRTQSGSNPAGDDAAPVGHGAELLQGNGSWSA